MVTLNGPELTPAQKKELESHKQNLKQIIPEMEGDYQKVVDLRKREASLEKKAGTLHRRAATFEIAAESELSSVLKQIERVHEAIHNAEANATHGKEKYFRIIDQAQECVQRVSQATYHQLLDEIAAALSPYYPTFNDARFAARAAPAVNALVSGLLSHRIAQFDPVERISEAAKDVLRKVNGILKGSEVWSYQGADGTTSSQ